MQTQQLQQAGAVELRFRAGGSDKVYRAAIEPRGTGFVVTFAFGRRGSALQAGTKTPAPVPYERAKAIYDRLVREKAAKGYTPAAGGTPYQDAARQERVTGVLPQLLNAVDEADVERLIADDAWWAQEKFDGRRILIRKVGDAITGINRTGLTVPLPAPLVAAAGKIEAAACLLDGEAVGDAYHAFDLLERDGEDLRPAPYAVRWAAAVGLVDPVDGDALRYAVSATTAARKRSLVARLRREGREGVVFKHRAAPYVPGRPAGGGSQLKLKFCATASCLVAGANGPRRSVAVELLDGTRRVGIGSVTIPPNHAVPGKGDVVEVRYLYAYPGGSLYQPVYLGRRDDIASDACVLAQLKYKPAADGGDEG